MVRGAGGPGPRGPPERAPAQRALWTTVQAGRGAGLAGNRRGVEAGGVSDDGGSTEVASVRMFTPFPSLGPPTVPRFLGLGYPSHRCRH